MNESYPEITGAPVGEPDNWTSDAEVVVLGSGAAGLFAAVEAAESGARTVLLESEADLGGSTRLSGGYAAFCETPLVPQGRMELLQDLDESHHHDSHFELSRSYVEQARETHDRLVELGVEFIDTMQFAHMAHPWAHEPGGMGGGAEIVHRLEQAAKRREVGLRLSTRAVALVRNDRGRITGVVADCDGRTETIRARRAVVLATGGFTRNLRLIRRYGAPGVDKVLPVTGAGSHGDGLVMGLGAGAATSYLEAGIAPTVPVEPGGSGAASLVNYKGAILVNREGRRFCDESQVYLDLCRAGLDQSDQMMIQVYDEDIRRDYLDWRLAHILGLCDEQTAPTLDALAETLETGFGVDGAALLDTVAQYNANVEAGRDPAFGRANLVGSAGALRRIANGPFHAAVLQPGTTHFNGGLRVNRNMQVLHPDGDTIPGLYAAGEITGGFHGAGYLSGSFVGSALIFGRIAGRNAADERRAWGEAEAGSFDVPDLP